ncbi:MAG: GntR family transcriptional regulator [Bacteroidetes bacterium]|jgi:DNA-binding transcriptional regulator YhcF (GntR family)|nr:GntR family transcriptional regulator [Bacteroidota bacterium]
MDFSDNRPIYLQIADHFCNQILNKKWTPDERIPSVRDVAVQLEVNPNTAIRAYHFLQDQDVLYNERGVGYFISDHAFDRVLEMKRKEFIMEKLPGFYRDMKMLGFSASELDELYREHHMD